MSGRFGPYTLDVAQVRLLREGQSLPLALRPKAFDLLVMLLSRPGELLSKDAVLDTVWGQRFISEGVIKSVVSELRGLLDTDPQAPRAGLRPWGHGTAAHGRSGPLQITGNGHPSIRRGGAVTETGPRYDDTQAAVANTSSTSAS